ncbi:hypothetical protein D9M72_504870 [compost metagenome]
MRQKNTSTLASMLPAVPLNVDWYCTMIAVVNVSKRIIANAPYSASRCSETRSAPPVMAMRSCGRTTRKNVRQAPRPSDAADCSIAGSSRLSVAAAGM